MKRQNRRDFKIPLKFGNYSHIPIVEEIAKGLKAIDKNNRYLEIGVGKSRCLNTIALHFNLATGVDISPEFKARIKGDNIVYWNLTTDEFFEKEMYKENSFDLIFIDACHEYQQVKKDFDNSYKLLKNGGIMILHDTYPPNHEYKPYCEDAYKIQYYLDELKIAYVTLPFYMGITILRKNPEVVGYES